MPRWNNPNCGFQKGNPGNPKGNIGEITRGKKPWNKGKPCERWLGNKNPNWKGGITPKNIALRHTIEFRLWREAVFARDNWTCQKCEIRGGTLHADHIKQFAHHPELRFAIDNGRTLCKSCHYKEPT